MDESLDISIEVRFVGDNGVSFEVLKSVLEGLTFAIERAEGDELNELIKAFPDWPSVASDAMRYRFDRVSRDRLLNIENASKGSIVLAGAAVGLAYWVADKTLGETVKEAWKESDGHTKLKDFLKKRVFKKREKIVNRLDRITLGEESLISSVDITLPDSRPVILVTVLSEQSALLPKPSQIEDKRGDA